ncbi:hypothetical protein EJ04DRAFT_210800 [Polyplosphaeria fusca]|uniref:Uncharacterized protein n=1 Tax=Polyplosphaeria fusca TaxID=682080 RepID=A0A9P4RCB4_9PLEO|nr:hypothetical protein EJ04DRAFT_210800 [Polyplosphaeria fusca]
MSLGKVGSVKARIRPFIRAWKGRSRPRSSLVDAMSYPRRYGIVRKEESTRKRGQRKICRNGELQQSVQNLRGNMNQLPSCTSLDTMAEGQSLHSSQKHRRLLVQMHCLLLWQSVGTGCDAVDCGFVLLSWYRNRMSRIEAAKHARPERHGKGN